MKKTASTIKQPFKNLENFFLRNGIKEAEESFFDHWLKQKQKNPTLVEILPDKVVVFVHGKYNSIDSIPHTLYDHIKSRMFEEIRISIESLKLASSEITYNSNSPDPFLKSQVRLLHEIHSQIHDVIMEYPFTVNMFNDVLTQINILLFEDKRYALFESIGTGTNMSIVPELFEFLNKFEIINAGAYITLLNLIKEFLNDFDTSRIKVNDMIDIKDENKILVRFCFYILWKSQEKSRGIKKYFVEFMMKVFVNFKHDNSLSSHFNEPPKDELEWYPDRVKIEIKRKNK